MVTIQPYANKPPALSWWLWREIPLSTLVQAAAFKIRQQCEEERFRVYPTLDLL